MKQIIQENLPSVINWAGTITILVLVGIGLQKCDSQWEDNIRAKRQFYIDNGYVECVGIGEQYKGWNKPEHCVIPPK